MKMLKIKVSGEGEITADGQPTTLTQLAEKLSELQKAGGTVWYHRENPEGAPHPSALSVMQLVVQNRLPIRLCVKPDFSE